MRTPWTFALLFAVCAAAAPVAAVSLGQIDDFQDGTTQGWTSGSFNPNPPVHVLDVGPMGAGDDSLQITSTGSIGAGSRFVAFNETQWTGDYLAAGVDMVGLDVHNIGATTLNLRVALDGAGGPFVTTLSVPISVASGWQTIGLSIAPMDLTSAGGLDVNATLAAVTQLRVISAVNPTFEGDSIVAQGLVDNVVAVPEPAQSVLLMAGLGLVWLLQQRRRIVAGDRR